jgi:hypothetical protein
MAGTNQQQTRQDRYPKGVLDPSLLPTHLVGTQAQIRLELPIDLPGVAASRARCTRSPSGRQRLSGGGAGGEKGLWNSYPR